MNFIKFFIASFFGRGARFFLVSTVLMFFGEAVKKYLELVILAVTVLIVIFCIIVYKKRHSLIGKGVNNGVNNGVNKGVKNADN